MILSLLMSLAVAAAPDFYANYAELSKAEREGADYRVVVKQRNAAVTVMAIHGGDIEIGTSDFATEIAQDDLNLYLFEGIKPTGNAKLHITSTHFDEPRALALARESRSCVSLHGFRELQRSVVCVGGANTRLRDKLAAQLAALNLGLEIEVPCLRFQGDSPENIVNRCKNPGVQVETSTALRRRFDVDVSLRAVLARTIKKVLLE